MEKQTILVCSAHAADFCSRSGGTIARYAKNGHRVKVIDLTYGERGESAGLWANRAGISIAEVKEIRRSEAVKAAGILGAEIEFLDYDDYPLVIGKERLLALTAKIKEFRPSIILTHWRNDPVNIDHATTAEAVLKACILADAPGVMPETPRLTHPALFMFEPDVTATELTGFVPDTYIDITDNFELKMTALRELASQAMLVGYYTHFAQHRAHQARGLSHRMEIKYAEGFKRYRPQVGTEFAV